MRIHGFVLPIVMGLLLSSTHASVQAKKNDEDASAAKLGKEETRARGRSADNSTKGKGTAESLVHSIFGS